MFGKISNIRTNLKLSGRACLPLLVLIVCSRLASAVQIPTASEYNLKAVYLYSFGRYTTWPKSEGGNREIRIAVLGDSPIIQPLEQISKTRKIKGRPIAIETSQSLSDYANCDIVFVSRTVSPESLATLRNAIKNRPVLLVGESTEFTSAGGMIRFFIDQSTVRFEINIQSVKQSGLVLDAKLLRLGNRPAP